jgi:hypothetical protein
MQSFGHDTSIAFCSETIDTAFVLSRPRVALAGTTRINLGSHRQTDLLDGLGPTAWSRSISVDLQRWAATTSLQQAPKLGVTAS